MNGIDKAISLCGRKADMARICGVSQTSVVKWINGGKMDPRYISHILKATNFEVNPTELRPDVDWATIYKGLKQVFE